MFAGDDWDFGADQGECGGDEGAVHEGDEDIGFCLLCGPSDGDHAGYGFAICCATCDIADTQCDAMDFFVEGVEGLSVWFIEAEHRDIVRVFGQAGRNIGQYAFCAAFCGVESFDGK